jgi:SAM-dependent methyltransferase
MALGVRGRSHSGKAQPGLDTPPLPPPQATARILRDRLRWRIVASVSSYRGRRLPPQSASRVDVPGDLLHIYSDKYAILRTNEKSPDETLLAFLVANESDFDLMEQALIENGYYEVPHIWPLKIDRDKRVMAEIVALLNQGGRVLEFGCASGTVLEGLAVRGIDFEGVDISRMALQKASPAVRRHIHIGDLRTVDLTPGFDTIFGLDIFEHLNPNKLGSYLDKLRSLLDDGGLLFANIPGFGTDEVFGEIFPRYLPEWDIAAAAGRHFQHLHVGHDGYPINGHLIWADSSWWVEQFAKADLRRQPDIEKALHRKYDDYMRARSPARRSFYVFSAGPAPKDPGLAARIEASASLELMTLRSLKTLAMLWR